MAEAYAFDLAVMTPEGRAVWLSVYAAGYRDGIEAGRRQLADEWREQHAVAAAIARAAAEAGPFDELAERRGQPERAGRQRAILVERGVVAR